MTPDPSSGHAVTPKTTTKDEVSCSVRARKLADQPIQDTELGVWAVLTAISKKARLRPQVSPSLKS
jgi:hypothetical protein